MCSTPNWIVAIATGVMAIGLVVCGIVYGVHFHKYKHYDAARCTVLSSQIQQRLCQVCDLDNNCYSVTCYQVDYRVNGTVGIAETSFVATIFGPERDSLRDAQLDQQWASVGSVRDCWYDTKNSLVATYNKPNAQKWLPAVIVFATLTLTGFISTLVCKYNCNL